MIKIFTPHFSEEAVDAMVEEYIRKNGDEKVGVGESIVTVFNDGVVIYRNTVGGTNASLILSKPYRIDCPYDVKTSEEAAFAEFEKEFGDRILENGDDFVTLFNDATLFIRMRKGVKETEVLKGKALEIDMDIVEKDLMNEKQKVISLR